MRKEKSKVKKVNIIGGMLLFIFCLMMYFSVSLDETMALREATPLAEANIRSFNHLAPIASPYIQEAFSPYQSPYFFTETQLPNQEPRSMMPSSEEDMEYITVYQGWEEDPWQSLRVADTQDVEWFVDESSFSECFDLHEVHNNFEEIDLSLLNCEESEEEFLKLLQKERGKFIFQPSPWPTHGWITSCFGYRISPFTGKRAFHKGIDIGSYHGTPVFASNRGVVVFSGYRGEYGNAVILQHGFGFSSLYGHNSINIVKSGDKVERGQLISYVGNTGRSTAPHLHYEIRKDGRCLNPRKYLMSSLF